MANLYTKNGKPLQRNGADIHDASGRHVGKVDGDKVYGSDGRYVGTLVGDRLIHRSIDSAGIRGAFVRSRRVASAAAPRVPSALWGDEPKFT